MILTDQAQEARKKLTKKAENYAGELPEMDLGRVSRRIAEKGAYLAGLLEGLEMAAEFIEFSNMLPNHPTAKQIRQLLKGEG